MQHSSKQPTVHVGKVWRLMLADLGLSAVAVLRRAGLPGGLLDGDGSRITLDEFYGLWESFDAEAQSPTLALKLGQIEASEFFDPAFFAAMCAPNMTVAGQRLGEFKRLVGAFSLDVDVMPNATRSATGASTGPICQPRSQRQRLSFSSICCAVPRAGALCRQRSACRRQVRRPLPSKTGSAARSQMGTPHPSASIPLTPCAPS